MVVWLLRNSRAEAGVPLPAKSLNGELPALRRCGRMGCEGESRPDMWPAAAAQDLSGGTLGQYGSRDARPAAPPLGEEFVAHDRSQA